MDLSPQLKTSANLDDWSTLHLPERSIGALAIYQTALCTIARCSDSFRTWTGPGEHFDTPFFDLTPRYEGFRPTTLRRVSLDNAAVQVSTTETTVVVPEQGSLRITVTDPKNDASESHCVDTTRGTFVVFRADLTLHIEGEGQPCALRVYT